MRCARLSSAAILLCASQVLLPAQTATVLHAFQNTADGGGPHGNLVQLPNGMLAGVSNSGGGQYSLPFIYTIAPDGSGFTDVHDFLQDSNPGTQMALAPDGAGGYVLYGTAEQDIQAVNPTLNGDIWSLDSSGNFTIIHVLASGEGSGPSALMLGADGNFWGMTGSSGNVNGSGPAGYGNIFKMSPAGAYSVVHSFSVADGIYPSYGLMQASDGNFYGTAELGGANGYTGGDSGYGTVYQVTPAGGFKVIYNFTNGMDGANPYAGLVECPEGTLWGSTATGGVTGAGTLFKMTFAGAITPTYQFAITDGSYPWYTMSLVGDGLIAGITDSGGVSGNDNSFGTIFSFNPSSPGKLAASVSLNNTQDGANPNGNVLQGTDGSLYVTTDTSYSGASYLLKFPLGLSPLLTMTLSSSTISPGQSTTLTWMPAVGYSILLRNCFAAGTDPAEWSGNKSSSGDLVLTPAATGTYTYSLICANGISASATLAVSKNATATVLTAPASVANGKSITLTATVAAQTGGTPIGKVNFLYQGLILESAPLNGSGVATASFTPQDVPLGTYALTAAYLGGVNFLSSTSAPISVSVTKEASATALTSSATAPIAAGTPVTLTATVTGGSGTTRPTGSVSFSGALNSTSFDLGTVNLNASQVAVVTANTTFLSGGAYTVTATYNGDDTFAASMASVAVTIKTVSATSLSASPNPAPALATVTLSAAVTGDSPTGTVTFSANGAALATYPLANGVATEMILADSTACGPYNLIAAYSGDANNGPSSGSTLLNVLGAHTNTVLSANPATVQQGSSTALTATVTSGCSNPAPSGTITFSIAGTTLDMATLSGGTATFSAQVTDLIDPGTYTVNASYSGDAYHAASSGTTSVTITK